VQNILQAKGFLSNIVKHRVKNEKNVFTRLKIRYPTVRRLSRINNFGFARCRVDGGLVIARNYDAPILNLDHRVIAVGPFLFEFLFLCVGIVKPFVNTIPENILHS